MKKKGYKVLEPDGTTCPRCDSIAETRAHVSITEKHLKQPFYFRRWYNCKNESCPTTTFMLEDWKVWNHNTAAKNFKLVQEDRENIERISLF